MGLQTWRLSCSASTYDTLELEKINPEQVDAWKASALRAVELPERTKGQPSAEKRLVKFLGLFPPEKRTSSGKSTYPIGPGVAGVVITTRRRQSGKPIADGWPIGRPHRQPGRPVGGESCTSCLLLKVLLPFPSLASWLVGFSNPSHPPFFFYLPPPSSPFFFLPADPS